MVAVNWVADWKVVVIGALLIWMTDAPLPEGGLKNPVPVTTSVNGDALTVPVIGEIWLMTGWVVTTVNVSGFEAPPPGAVVLTTTVKSPGDVRLLAPMLAVR